MAKINEQKITIKLSQLLRDDQSNAEHIVDDENLALLLEAITAMVGPKVMIELE